MIKTPLSHKERYDSINNLTISNVNCFFANNSPLMSDLTMTDKVRIDDFKKIHYMFPDIAYAYFLKNIDYDANEYIKDGDVIDGIKVIGDGLCPVMNGGHCNLAQALFCDDNGPVCVLWYPVTGEKINE